MRLGWFRSGLRALRAELPAYALGVLLCLVVAQSTDAMVWVRGNSLYQPLATAGFTMVALLAVLRRLPGLVSLVLSGIAAIGICWYFSSPPLIAGHPGAPFGIPSPLSWPGRLQGGDQAIDVSLFFLLGNLIFFVVGGWLAWCTIRWRSPLLGIVPAVAIFATNVLNSRDEQNANTLYFLILLIALLLWNNYRTSLVRALRSGLRMTTDSRWDFWETGVAATVGVMLLAILVPPLTHEDQTVSVQAGVFGNWAEFQQNFNHQLQGGRGGMAQLSTGFATDASLNGPLSRSERVVLQYTIQGSYPGPVYLRGLNLQVGLPSNQWAYHPNLWNFEYRLPSNATLAYSDSLREQGGAVVKVRMIHPPKAAPDVLFYPGILDHTDRDIIASETNRHTGSAFGSVDRVTSQGHVSFGSYQASIQFSNPTEDQLRNSGSDYPGWIASFRTLPALLGPAPMAPPGVSNPRQSALDIKKLADQVVAPFNNQYDRATAIESFLRANYTYTLAPPSLVAGQDPLHQFLFDSKQGYCEYFATAMGDMLRAEGIPSRLVNGFGPGIYDNHLKTHVVRESDAHTWVEVYFPDYGWIPFEPTPDPNYQPIARALPPNACGRDGCSTGAADSSAAAAAAKRAKDLPGDLAGQGGSAGRAGQPGYWSLVPIFALLLLALLFVSAIRYLRPRTAAQTWRRFSRLGRLAGVGSRPADTPTEYGRRLGEAFPEAAQGVRSLAEAFTVSAYAPPDTAGPAGAQVVERWADVRSLLLRRLVGRLRPAWGTGQT